MLALYESIVPLKNTTQYSCLGQYFDLNLQSSIVIMPGMHISCLSVAVGLKKIFQLVGQIVQSNLFYLGHLSVLAGQTLIMSYHYLSAPSPFTWCLNMKQIHFQSIYCTWAKISLQDKWNSWYSKISITFVWKFATIARNFMTIFTNNLLKITGLVD